MDYRGQAVGALSEMHLSYGLPTLLIWGEQDRIIPVAHGYAAHDAVPGSRLEVLAGVGHCPPCRVPDSGGGHFLTTPSPPHGGMPI